MAYHSLLGIKWATFHNGRDLYGRNPYKAHQLMLVPVSKDTIILCKDIPFCTDCTLVVPWVPFQGNGFVRKYILPKYLCSSMLLRVAECTLPVSVYTKCPILGHCLSPSCPFAGTKFHT